MRTLRRLVLTALVAGLLCGLAVTAARTLWVTPLILAAERYEAAEAPAAPGHEAHGHGDTAPGTDAVASLPVGRLALSALADTLLAIGGALLLVAAMTAHGRAGWRVGLGFGLAGYVVTVLAPALGLPPELPGTVAAPLPERQLWWVATALATAAGLGGLLLGRRPTLAALGALLIAAPHLVGAPQPEAAAHAAPAALVQRFEALVLVTDFLFWCLLGAVSGSLLARARAAPTAPKPLPAAAA